MGEAKELKAETSRERDEILRRQNGDKGKFNKYNLKLKIAGKLLSKLAVYLASFGLKIVGWLLLRKMNRNGRIGKVSVYFVYYQRRVHKIALGVAMPDLVFYGTRVLVHSRVDGLGWGEVVGMGVLGAALGCLFYELAEISMVTFGLRTRLKEERMVREEVRMVGEEVRRLAEGDLRPQIGVNGSEKVAESPVVLNSKTGQKLRFFAKEPTESHRALQGPSKNSIYAKRSLKIPKKAKNGKSEKDKILSQEITLSRINRNSAIEQASLSTLNHTISTLESTICLLNNHLFTLKMAAHQLLLASLPHLPFLQVSLMALIELSDLIANLLNYWGKRHMKSGVMFLIRITNSVFVVLFLLLSLYISVKFGSDALYIDPSVQSLGRLLILIGMVLEYFLIFLLMISKLVGALRGLCRKKDPSKNQFYVRNQNFEKIGNSEKSDSEGGNGPQRFVLIEKKGPLYYLIDGEVSNTKIEVKGRGFGDRLKHETGLGLDFEKETGGQFEAQKNPKTARNDMGSPSGLRESASKKFGKRVMKRRWRAPGVGEGADPAPAVRNNKINTRINRKKSSGGENVQNISKKNMEDENEPDTTGSAQNQGNRKFMKFKHEGRPMRLSNRKKKDFFNFD